MLTQSKVQLVPTGSGLVPLEKKLKIDPEKYEEMERDAEEKYGPLLVEEVHPNPMALAYFLSRALGTLVYIAPEDRLYRRNMSKGLFETLQDDILASEILDFLIRYFLAKQTLSVPHKFETNLAKKIIALIKRFCRKDDFFVQAPNHVILHLQNCFLVCDGKKMQELPLATDWIHSRNQLAVKYDPKAKADRFLSELLAPVLDQDEIEILLMYAAQCMIGRNISEKILLIIGAAGAGKSVIVNIIEGILGRSNVTQLRTECLHGWYETNRYIGRNLLVGKDVASDFLRRRGAYLIKALTGKDLISTEAKHSNFVGEITGDYNVIITSNSNQPILLQQDRDAWERRVLTIKFKGKKPQKVIPDFDKLLINTEGAGIFNEILSRLMTLLANDGQIQPSESQKMAISNLLDESESAKVFLSKSVEPVEPLAGCSLRQCKENLTAEELYLKYLEYCQAHDWLPLPTRKFKEQLVDLMPSMYQRFRRNDIVRNGTNHRGFYAVRFIH